MALPPQPSPSAEQSEQFIRLLNAAHSRLLGFLMSLLGNRADAEDVLQRASLQIWRKFSEFDPTLDFFAWASAFAFYEAKNFQRLALRSPLHFDERLMERLAEERLIDVARREARLAALDRCIEEIEPSGRELIREFYLRKTNMEELSKRFERAPQTLYNKLNTLRRLLAECVARRMALES